MTEAIRQGDIPGVQLRRRRRFAGVSAAELWRWVSEVHRLERWAARRAAIEPSADLELVDKDGRRELGESLDRDAPRRWILAFRREEWKVATRLELEITEDASGTELSILQQGFEHLPLSDGLTLWEAYRHRWTEALDRLEAVLG